MKRFSFLLILFFSFFFFSCEEEVTEGCTDQTACNYNPEATESLLGACNYPLESILEFTYSEDNVSGVVGEDVIAHIHLQNSSCETVSIKARKIFNGSEESSAYFCFAGVCFGSEITVSPTTLILESFQEDDYFFVHILYGTFIMSSADMSGMNWDGTNVMLLHIDNNFTSFKK